MNEEPNIIPGGPGIKTSEFLGSALAVVANVIGVLVIMGLIPKNDQESISAAVAAVLTGGCMVFANAIILWNYIKSRLTLKVQASENLRDAAFHASQAGLPLPSSAPGDFRNMNLAKLWPMAKPWLLMAVGVLGFFPGGAKAKVIIEAVITKIDEIVVANPNI